MAKIKVMAIAPYDGLLEILNRIGTRFPMLDITALKGDLKEGVGIAMDAEKEGYDIIISRGGTSEKIKEAVSIPVINIEVSGYDYIRAMKLIQRFSGKSAMIGFSYITAGAQSINDLLKTDLDIITIHSEDEVDPLLSRLSKEGYSLIIGDVVTNKTAQRLGLNGMLLTSGDESVTNAFEEVIRLFTVLDRYKKRSDMFNKIVEEYTNSIMVFDSNRKMLFSNFDKELQNEVMSDLVANLDNIAEYNRIDFIIKKNDVIYSFTGKQLDHEKSDLISVYYLRERLVSVEKKLKGIYFKGIDSQTEGVIPSLFRNRTNQIASLIDKVRDYSMTRLPILIEGELGVGKEILAYWIHRNSENQYKPFVTVNCEIADQESINYFFDHWDSFIPFESGATLLIKQINKLDYSLQKQLLNLFLKPKFSKNCRILTSTTENLLQMSEKKEFLVELYYKISKLNIYVPSMEERVEEMENLCNLCIIEANSKFGKQIIQIDDDAVSLLKKKKWIYNFEQFRKIMEELVLSVNNFYIHKEDVEKILEQRNIREKNEVDFIDKFNNFEEIEAYIFKEVLRMEKGNQVKAALRLGVSRSTLWRKIKLYNISSEIN